MLALDVLALQETRVPVHSRSAVESAFRHAGWNCVLGSQAVAATGQVQYGTAILSRLPVLPFALPADLLPDGRGSAVRLHRPSGRPVLLINVYLPAASEAQAAGLLDEVFCFVASKGDEAVLLGDFNLPPDRAPVVDARAVGTWRLAEETVAGDVPPQPTRRDEQGQPIGRCIDFALSTVGVPALDRQQTPGPADHDLISYTFSIAKDRRELPRAPLRRPAPCTPAAVTAQAWELAWTPHAAEFDRALLASDVDAAWVLLSDVAERLLMGEPPTDANLVPRSRVVAPKPRPPPSTKSEALQSHPERRLRRLARRALELQRRPEDPASARLWHRVLKDADELHVIDRSGPQAIADAALRQAALLEAAASQGRIKQWHDDVQNNMHRLRRWVRRTVGPAPGPLADTPVHPVDIVAAEHDKWGAQWATPAPHTPEETRAWCTRLGPPTDPWAAELLRPAPAAVLACLRASAQRAPGLDAWAPASLALLPLPFFELVTRLWAQCLHAARLPGSWYHVRITLLPKDDGGLRPLAIASAIWQALGTVVVRNLRAWSLSWAPPALLGSMPGRSCSDLHASFAADVHHARCDRLQFAGYKADVKRCFDSVHVPQALEVARWLGAPAALMPLLRNFYEMQQRHMSWQGVYHPAAIRPLTGLLQGCPFSPLLLNCIVCVWVRVVQQAAPRAVVATYLDDRSIWATGRQPGPIVLAAAQAGEPVDIFFGLRHHPEKLACFGLGAPTRRLLEANSRWVGPVKQRFVLLGVQYVFGLTCLPDAAGLSAMVDMRCQRIAYAARGLALRRNLIRELVLPLFSWSAPWSKFKVADVKKWTQSVAFALWGRQPAPGRSRLLLWHVLGRPYLHPEHATDFAVGRQEWYRCSRRPTVVLTRPAIVPRWPAVLKKWGWTCLGDGSWRTPLGTLKPGWDGLCALRRAADYAFLQRIWAQDPKSAPFDLALSAPCFEPLRQLVAGADRRGYRTATACAADARVLQRLKNPPAPAHLACTCGEPAPTRTHLTFYCSAADWTRPAGSHIERGFLCKLLPLPLYRPPAGPGLDLELVSEIVQAAAAGPVICATDGGAFTRPELAHWQRAAWALAVATANGRVVVGGLVTSFEQTPAAAEREALWRLLLHLRRADVPACVFLDNKALVLRLQRGLRDEAWEGSNPAFWTAVSSTARRDLQAHWIPSHGKQPRWQAENPEHTALARALNREADVRCSAMLQPLRDGWQSACDCYDSAVDWGSAAVRAQHGATGPFHEMLKTAIGELRTS
eukprot:s897_g13.t1